MQNQTYFQQIKSLIWYGIKIVFLPLFLTNSILAVLLSIGLSQSMWDYEFMAGVMAILFVNARFMIIAFLGIVLISIMLTANIQLSNITVVLSGLIIGTIIIIVGNYIHFLWLSYELISLSCIATILILAYVGGEMNSHLKLNSETIWTEMELQGCIWMMLIAFIGSLGFALIQVGIGNILDTSIYLGSTLSYSLPFAILAGLLIGIIIKKNNKNA